MPSRSLPMVLLQIVLLLVFSGCGSDSEDSVDTVPWSPMSEAERDSLLADLKNAEERWTQMGVETYRYELGLSENNWGVPRVELQVSQDTIRTVEIPDGDGALRPGIAPSLPTVGDMFALLDSALVNASSVRTEFHPAMGYPHFIRIDYSSNVFDDEVSFTVRDLDVLETQ